MKFASSTLTALLAFGASISVHALNPRHIEQSKRLNSRTTAGVYFCNNDNWAAPCDYMANLNIDSTCYNLPSRFQNSIASFGPDAGAKYCVLFTGTGCTGTSSTPIQYPGVGGLETYPGIYHAANSLRCGTLSQVQVSAGVYFCNNDNFGTPCYYMNPVIPDGTCYNVPSGYQNSISSFGPDRGAEWCVLFTGTGCTGLSMDAIQYPGAAYLENYIGMNDHTNSFRCGPLATVLIPPTLPTFPSNSQVVTVPMTISNTVTVFVGADALTTGATGSSALVDTGNWDWSPMLWSGCQSNPMCTNGANHKYSSSTTDFVNLTTQDTTGFSWGSFSSWRVKDAFKWGTALDTSTTFDAIYSSAGDFFGSYSNIGAGISYCNGVSCYGAGPNIFEGFWMARVTTAPVLTLFSVLSTDTAATGVTSQAGMGGIDANKYTGHIDWIRVANYGYWVVPNSQRILNLPSGSSWDMTNLFAHTSSQGKYYSTQKTQQLGIPADDFALIATQAGAVQDSSGNYAFPCNTSVGINMHGSQNQVYNVILGDPTNPYSGQSGFCYLPSTIGHGPGTSWALGIKFIEKYYSAWYYGNLGVGATLGFASKNLGASAATVYPVTSGSG